MTGYIWVYLPAALEPTSTTEETTISTTAETATAAVETPFKTDSTPSLSGNYIVTRDLHSVYTGRSSPQPVAATIAATGRRDGRPVYTLQATVAATIASWLPLGCSIKHV